MKNTFLTYAYKDGFIHSCYNPETSQEEVQMHLYGEVTPVKSHHAAKILITLKMQPTNTVVASDYWIYGVNLTERDAERVLLRAYQLDEDCDAYITHLQCSCGSNAVTPYESDGKYSHFYCEHCGNTVDDHRYDAASFRTLIDLG